jgi:hypothetical protein
MAFSTEPSRSRSSRTWAVWGVKLGLSLLLLWLALRHVPLASVTEAVRAAHPAWALASLAVFLGGVTLFDALRFSLGGGLLREAPQPLGQWAFLSLASRAFLYLLPSGMGQEGYLWVKLRNRGWKHGSCAFLVLLVRATGLAFWCFALAFALRSPGFRGATAWVLRGSLAEVAFWVAAGLALTAGSMFLPVLLGRMGRLEGYSGSLAAWAGLLLATAGTGFTCAAAFEFSARAFGISFGLAQAAGCTTILFLGMVLPISLAGFGVQEGILLMVGQGLGMPPGPLLGLSCLLHFQRFVMALAGLSCLMAGKWDNPGQPSALAPEEGGDG